MSCSGPCCWDFRVVPGDEGRIRHGVIHRVVDAIHDAHELLLAMAQDAFETFAVLRRHDLHSAYVVLTVVRASAVRMPPLRKLTIP